MRRSEVGQDLESLAFDFLYFFARFEYALPSATSRERSLVSPLKLDGDNFESDGKVSIKSVKPLRL